MSKRISDEERIVDFFTTADTGKVETLSNIVKGIVKKRLAGSTKTGKRTSTKPASSGNGAAPHKTPASIAPDES
jgi:hypothetical protein